MIEFAPNPSGPAHIGTLRTYCVAWLLSRQEQTGLFVRFDAHNLNPSCPRLPKWADSFLQELAQIGMPPDAWEYCESRLSSQAVPDWAEHSVRRVGGVDHQVAIYPRPVPTIDLPSKDASDYTALELPLVTYQDDEWFWYFAERRNGRWEYDEALVSLIQMNLRGTTAIVRSQMTAFIRPSYEEPANQWFGIRLPREVLTGVVTDGQGALSKSRLQPGSRGTIEWAIQEKGVDGLRSAIILSATHDARPVIPLGDVLCLMEQGAVC